jgi:hypothetical protein
MDNDRQIPAHDLTADAQRFSAAPRQFQTGPGGFVVRRLADAGIHQHFGIDEHRSG